MVVDIKRCVEQRIAIWCTNKEQSNQIWMDYYKYFNKKPIKDTWYPEDKNGFEVFLNIDDTPCWQDNYNKTYFIEKHKASCCLDYNGVILNKIYELW